MSKVSSRDNKRNEGKTPISSQGHSAFEVKSILELCWGLSLILSHEKGQQELGNTFKEQFLKTFATYHRSAVEVAFLDNLLMSLSTTIRNIGFVREIHVRYLDFQSHQFAQQEQNLNRTADFFSFSGSGLYAKVASFLGVGSLADLANILKGFQGFGLQPADVAIFLTTGAVGAFAVTSLAWGYRKYAQKKFEQQLLAKETPQNKYWREHYKPDMGAVLYTLVLDIKRLAETYSTNSWSPVNKDDELFKLSEKEAKRRIQQEILPPDDLSWPPSFDGVGSKA